MTELMRTLRKNYVYCIKCVLEINLLDVTYVNYVIYMC